MLVVGVGEGGEESDCCWDMKWKGELGYMTGETKCATVRLLWGENTSGDGGGCLK